MLWKYYQIINGAEACGCLEELVICGCDFHGHDFKAMDGRSYQSVWLLIRSCDLQAMNYRSYQSVWLWIRSCDLQAKN